MQRDDGLRWCWVAAVSLAIASRLWNALAMPVLRGFDANGHVAYALFLDLYRAVPYADQGWSYFHPPLHYLFGWLLAQVGAAEVLVRGLALVSSAASLLTAALAAHAVRLGMPERPVLALLAFVAVAFLPVHVYSSTMPGNELTAAFFSSLTIAVFLRNEMRTHPTLVGDVATGFLAGLALLTKFSGLLTVLVIAATIGWRCLRGADRGLVKGASRVALVAGVAAIVCAPYYARNVSEFGTPFQLSRDFALVSALEETQPPGERSWHDLLRFPAKAFMDPDPEAEHLLDSIPGSVFVNVWVDARPDIEPPLARTVLLLGVVPTGLALLGLLLCVRAAFRRNEAVATTVAVLGLASVAALIVMAFRVPTFAMLKASYLLGGSIAYGYCVACGAAALRGRAHSLALALIALGAALEGVASTPGWLRPARIENERMGPVHAYFGEHAPAEAIFRRRIVEVVRPERRTLMRENLAGSLLEAGQYQAARAIYDGRKRAFGAPPHLEAITSPLLMSRRAVATALAGDRTAARALLDRAIGYASNPLLGTGRDAYSPLLVNRAALRARDGELDGAESDLLAALDAEPDNAAAWRVLAFVRASRGDDAEAERTREEARRLSYSAPRGFPYGVGNGFHLNGQRFMLVVEAGELALYRPGRARGGSARASARPGSGESGSR